MAIFPEVRWAQRSSESSPEKNIIWLTIAVFDIVDEKVELTPTHLKFAGTDASNQYEIELEFYDEVVPEESREIKTAQGHTFLLRKKTPQAEYWPRLLKDKARKPWIRTDFDHWVDEDEQDGNPADDFGVGSLGGDGGNMGGESNFDLSSLLGGAGAGGPGGSGLEMSKLQEMMSQYGGNNPDLNDETSSSLGEAEEEEQEDV